MNTGVVDQNIPALGDHHRVEHNPAWAALTQHISNNLGDFTARHHANFNRVYHHIIQQVFQLLAYGLGRNGVHRGHPAGILGNHRGNHVGAVNAKG